MTSPRTLVLLALAVAANTLAAAPKIGVLLRDHDVFYSAVERGALDAGGKLGVEVIAKAPARANAVAQQVTLLGVLAKESIDALVVAPLTVAEFKQPLADLAAKGVKIVVIELPIPDAPYTFIGYDQAEMAATAAKRMAALIQDGDEITLLRANSLYGLTVREKTLIATLKALRPKSALNSDVMSGLEKGDDRVQALHALEAHPGTKLFCTAFTASTLGGIQAVQEKGLGGKLVHAGFGSGLPDEAVAAIQSGQLQLWVSQQPKLIGAKAVEIAVQLAEGKSLPPTVAVPYTVVTKENIDSPEVRAIRQ